MNTNSNLYRIGVQHLCGHPWFQADLLPEWGARVARGCVTAGRSRSTAARNESELAFGRLPAIHPDPVPAVRR